ncbi:MAG: hypothetical protein V3U42_04895 [candidate division NC10 bacterium]|jgi:hypothetical protein|nr:hypothetical protein [candidate division NC10 bacterium]
MFYHLLILFLLGLLGLTLLLKVAVEGSFGNNPVAWLLVFVSLFGGGFLVFFLERCLWHRKGDSEDRLPPDDGIGQDS